MLIRDFLHENTQLLHAAGIATARLDVLVLLSDALQKDKAWILSHDDTALTPQELSHLQQAITRRKTREPLAYIRGHQEFYGRDFAVNPAVLIPRPETERLLELLPHEPHLTMIDIGTGSGVIAITAKLQHPTWSVTACDIDEDALLTAAYNADNLGAKITLRRSDLLTDITGTFDVIAANLPYVDETWERNSPETSFEPELALFADNSGLALIAKLLVQLPAHLSPQGTVLLEADPEQHQAIISLAQKEGLTHVQTLDYIVALQRN